MTAAVRPNRRLTRRLEWSPIASYQGQQGRAFDVQRPFPADRIDCTAAILQQRISPLSAGPERATPVRHLNCIPEPQVEQHGRYAELRRLQGPGESVCDLIAMLDREPPQAADRTSQPGIHLRESTLDLHPILRHFLVLCHHPYQHLPNRLDARPASESGCVNVTGVRAWERLGVRGV